MSKQSGINGREQNDSSDALWKICTGLNSEISCKLQLSIFEVGFSLKRKGEGDCCRSVPAGGETVRCLQQGFLPSANSSLSWVNHPTVSQKVGRGILAPWNQESLFALLQPKCCSLWEQRLNLSQGLSRIPVSALFTCFQENILRHLQLLFSSFVRLFSQDLYAVQKFCFTSQCVYVQVRKLISRLSEQLKQFWPAWLRFDSGFGFVVTHQAHVAINSTDHTL